MLKKIFIFNQIIFAFLLLGIIGSALFVKYAETKTQNTFSVKHVQSRYDIYLVNNNYVISSFEGSGGFLDGGIISKSKVADITLLTDYEILELIENNSDYAFPCESFENSVFAIGNFDFDQNVEIFIFSLVGTNFLHPMEIAQNGEVRKENFFTYVLIRFLASFWMLPNFIFYFLFFAYYIVVCGIYLIVTLVNKRKINRNSH